MVSNGDNGAGARDSSGEELRLGGERVVCVCIDLHGKYEHGVCMAQLWSCGLYMYLSLVCVSRCRDSCAHKSTFAYTALPKVYINKVLYFKSIKYGLPRKKRKKKKFTRGLYP